jgi:hypothetical protein
LTDVRLFRFVVAATRIQRTANAPIATSSGSSVSSSRYHQMRRRPSSRSMRYPAEYHPEHRYTARTVNRCRQQVRRLSMVRRRLLVKTTQCRWHWPLLPVATRHPRTSAAMEIGEDSGLRTMSKDAVFLHLDRTLRMIRVVAPRRQTRTAIRHQLLSHSMAGNLTERLLRNAAAPAPSHQQARPILVLR